MRPRICRAAVLAYTSRVADCAASVPPSPRLRAGKPRVYALQEELGVREEIPPRLDALARGASPAPCSARPLALLLQPRNNS